MSTQDSAEQNRSACDGKHSTTEQQSIDGAGPTVVHERSGIQYTFDSMDELAVMFRSLANFCGVRQSCEQFRLKDDTDTMRDVYEYGLLVFEQQYSGHEWLAAAMNDSVAMTDRYYNGEYDAANVGVTDATANKTTVLYEDSPVEAVITVFRNHGLGERIDLGVFGGVDGSDSVLNFFSTLGVLEYDSDDETVVLEDSQKTTDVLTTLD